MGVPPASHFIYIPFVLLMGVVLGFILGGRAARDAEASRVERERARAERRAARAVEKKDEEKPTSPSG